MTIEFTCPACHKLLKVRDDAAGRRAKCPDCAHELEIPRPFDVPDDASASPVTDGGGGEAESGDNGDRKPCPLCGQMIKKAASKCRFCGEVFRQIRRPEAVRGASAFPVADLGKRFLAAMADSLAGMVVMGPGLAMILYKPNNPDPLLVLVGLGLLFVGFVALLVAQLWLLIQRSQSLGKYFLNIQIHDYESGERADFVHCFLMRAVVSGLIGGIPCIGPIYSIVDIFFIFGEDHRCLHDKLANTYVVDISGAESTGGRGA